MRTKEKRRIKLTTDKNGKLQFPSASNMTAEQYMGYMRSIQFKEKG